MATMSFKKTAEEIKTQPAEVTDIVVVEPKPLATRSEPQGDVTGYFSMRDIKLPRISIVQKISEDASVFGAGAIVFNREVKLAVEGQKIPVTFLRIDKQFEEKLPIGAERMPDIKETPDEVLQAGGSLKYGDPNYYQEIAHIQAVIPKPENASDQEALLFPYEAPDGKWFGLALWTVRSTAYTPVVPTLYTANKMFLKDGLCNGSWDLSTEKRTNLKGSWHVPAIRFNGRHQGEMQEFMNHLRNGGN